MADLNAANQWLVDPTVEVKKKWHEAAIQEKYSRIVRYKQDIEDLMKGKIVELEAKIIMLDMEIKELEAEKRTLEAQPVPSP